MFNSIRNQLIFLLLSFLFLTVSCSSTDQQIPSVLASIEENPLIEEEKNDNEAPIDHIEIMMLESFPIHVNIVARGNFPTSCTSIAQITEEQSGNTLIVKITTALQTDLVCTNMIKPFEEIIPLNVAELSAGFYTVKVNNMIDTFELNVDNIIP